MLQSMGSQESDKSDMTATLNNSNTNRKKFGQWLSWAVIRGYCRTFLNDVNVLYFVCGGGYTTVGEGNATHFSIPAWRIPWTVEPDGLQSLGSQRVGYD